MRLLSVATMASSREGLRAEREARGSQRRRARSEPDLALAQDCRGSCCRRGRMHSLHKESYSEDVESWFEFKKELTMVVEWCTMVLLQGFNHFVLWLLEDEVLLEGEGG